MKAEKKHRQNRERTEREQGKNKETFDKFNTLKNKSDVEMTWENVHLSTHKKRGIMQNSAKQVKSVLPFKVGAVLDIAGKVQKVVKRDGQCKLVIEPGDVPGFVVFADCPGELENLTKLNIRKGSLVSVRGKFQTFGAAAVCLSDCRIKSVGDVDIKPKEKT